MLDSACVVWTTCPQVDQGSGYPVHELTPRKGLEVGHLQPLDVSG